MEHLVSALVTFASEHSLLAYGIAFLLAGSESFPVFGALVPGTATIIALGALVPTGALGWWQLIGATTAGAVAGDGFSYWIGHHYKERAAGIWPLRGHPGLIEKGEAFFTRHGGKAIVIARFTPGVRAIVPLAGGILRMPILRFYIINVISALLWAPSHVAIGVAIGASLTVLGAIAGRLAAAVFGLFLITWLVIWATPRLVRELGRVATPEIERLRGWAASGNTWPQHRLSAVFNTGMAEIRGLAVIGGLLVGSFWLLMGVIQDILVGDPLVRADRVVLNAFHAVRLEWADRLATAIAALSAAPVTLGAAAVMLVWLLWHKAWRAASYELAALAGAAVLPLITVLLPGSGWAPIRSGEFPPGWQIAEATAFYIFLGVIVGREAGTRVAGLVSAGIAVLLVFFGLARLYLGAEWLSVLLLAGAFAAAWVAILSIGYLSHPHHAVRPTGLLIAVGLAFFALGGLTIGFAETELQPPPVQSVEMMPFQQWLAGGWQTLPARRVDLLGERTEPLTLQWAGSLDRLKAELASHGWTVPVPWSWRSAPEWLSPNARLDELPVLPHLEDGRPEALVMVKTGTPLHGKERVVLRVWPSAVRLADGTRILRLWIGAVTIERIEPVSFLFTEAVTEKVIGPALSALHAALPETTIRQRGGAAAQPVQTHTVLLGVAPPG